MWSRVNVAKVHTVVTSAKSVMIEDAADEFGI
jgi:hypothetical protein